MPNYSYISIFRSLYGLEVIHLLGSPGESLKESKRTFRVPERSLGFFDIWNGFYMPNYSYVSIFRSLYDLEVIHLLGSPEESLKESKRTFRVPERSLGFF